MWIFLHILFAVLGECLLGIASFVSLIYLIQENRLKRRLASAFGSSVPSLEVLDSAHYRMVLVGFCLLTLAIFLGGIQAFHALNLSWFWAHKQLWTLLGWFVYAAILKARLSYGLRGKRAAWYSLVGFSLVFFFTFFRITS